MSFQDFWNGLGPLLGVFVGSVIGYLGNTRQIKAHNRTESNRIKLELYDRRLKFYHEWQRLYTIIIREATCDRKDIFAFRAAIDESVFLFDDEMYEFLHEVGNKAVELIVTHEQLSERSPEHHIPIGQKRTELAKTNSEALTWFWNQEHEARKRFAKYLRLST